MRIGIFIPHLHGGGAEFVTRRWINELERLGHEVTVYVYDRNQPPVDLPASVRVRAFAPWWHAARHVVLPLWLRRQLARDRPDVLLSMLTYSNVVALLTGSLLRTDVSLVVSERNMPSLEYAGGRTRDQITSWFAKRLYRRAAGVIAISHPVAGDLVSAFRVPAKRLYVVPNPVIARSAQGEPADPAVGMRTLHVAFVGRLVEQKRPVVFLEVLAALKRRGVQVRGTMIGEGPLREQSEAKAKRLGVDVAFMGWHEPWWTATHDVDCLLLTARFEGLANVLIEAAAVNIPSVASSRALGIADAIVPGLTGELSMTDDPEDYANAVLRACSSSKTGRAAVPAWLRRFSVEESTEYLLAALRRASESGS